MAKKTEKNIAAEVTQSDLVRAMRKYGNNVVLVATQLHVWAKAPMRTLSRKVISWLEQNVELILKEVTSPTIYVWASKFRTNALATVRG